MVVPNGWWHMPPEPVPADPGWDEDLTWLDRDPERQTWLDRAEHDDPPGPEESGGFPGLTPDELADIEDAAADELLAVVAAASGRPRGRGVSPWSAGTGRPADTAPGGCAPRDPGPT